MQYSNEGMESLHTLPLAVLPFQTKALASVNLIKNTQLRSVIELFSGEQTGSGQIEINDIGSRFDELKDAGHPDFTLLRELGKLRSYDVYSLRITLREQGIPIDKGNALRLSSTKQAASTDFMRNFTQNLLKETFAPIPTADDDRLELVVDDDDDDDSADKGRHLSKLINPIDPENAHSNLGRLAERLEIKLDDLPNLLEDFADLHLSVAYYESCYGELEREFDNLFALMSQLIRTNSTFQRETAFLQKCDRVEFDVAASKRFVQAHLGLFGKLEREFWNEVSAKRFREIEDVAKANQVQLGGILCGMTKKMNAWNKMFPRPELVTPHRLAGFITTELGGDNENMQASD